MNFNDEDYAYIKKFNYVIDVRDRNRPALIKGLWSGRFDSIQKAIEFALAFESRIIFNEMRKESTYIRSLIN